MSPARRLSAALTIGLAAALGLSLPGRAAPGEMVAGVHQGLAYRLHVPGGATGRKPLVVMLHGCTQDPEDFARGTRMNQLADREGFFVLYPGQSPLANPRRCWNWFMPAHQARGRGEPAAIAGLIEAIAGRYEIDRRRVYVAGLSAGGAMAAVLGATYPEVFAAVGVCAGLAYGVAHDVDSALRAMAGGAPAPQALPARLVAAAGGRRLAVPLLVLQGSRDTRVAPLNADQLAAQWAAASGLAGAPAALPPPASPGARQVERVAWRDATGRPHVERWLIAELAHAWPGGDPAGSHVDPLGPAASEAFWAFFRERKR